MKPLVLPTAILSGLLVSTLAPAARADDAAASGYTTRPSVMAGMSQWVVFGGGNLAAQVKWKRLAFEYSHGQALHYNRIRSLALTKEEREANVELSSPWTTGGGMGVQITPNLHVLIEVKAHRFQVDGPTGDRAAYTTFTVGPGVFYDLYVWRGLFVQPSFRYWPTVASTHANETVRREDGTIYAHKRHDFVPFANVNVGWTFEGR